MKLRPVGAKLFHVGEWMDEQTDMTKLIVTFCNFVYVPKINKNVINTCKHIWKQ
jgi:hypothetical protein